MTATPLKVDNSELRDIHQQVCGPYSVDQLDAKLNVERHDYNIASSEFMPKLNEIITSASAGVGTYDEKLVLNNFVTLNNDTLMLFAWAVLDHNDIRRITDGRPLPAASTLIFEVSTDNKIKAFLNDNQAHIQGCSSLDCSVAAVSATLAQKVVYTDLATTCAL